MILLDLSQILYSSIMASIKDYQDLNEDFFRHIALNVIRSNYMKFKHSYGKLVVAIDSPSNWRKDIFPYYKAARAEARAANGLDWKKIHGWMRMIENELKNYFPYAVVGVDKAEADDVIATICMASFTGEEILILSADKDYGQLQHLGFVKQFDPLRKRWIEIEKPREFLKDLIIRGDVSDGIPNILSMDSCFVSKMRQKPMTKDRVTFFMENDPMDYDELALRGFRRNEGLIDLHKIPPNIQASILAVWVHEGVKGGNLWGYFKEKNLPNLLHSINDFR